jgi:TatD DNase family protein
MGWVDTHCHLQLAEQPATQLLERARSVDWMVVPGIDSKSSRAAIELCARHPDRLLPTAGLHPHDAEHFDTEWDDIVALAVSAVAIGETGLDYYRDLSPRESQCENFRHHIALALEVGKPLITHCRDAFSDVYDLIEASGVGPSTVLHCWTGGPRWTKRFLDLGVTFSFAGPVAFETGDTVRRGAALVPPERAMVETDTPYLAPPPHRTEDNEPEWVSLVGAALARVWSMDIDVVSVVTSQRAREVFGGPPGTTT